MIIIHIVIDILFKARKVVLRIRDGVGLVRIPWLNSDIRTQRVTRFRTESFWEHSHG